MDTDERARSEADSSSEWSVSRSSNRGRGSGRSGAQRTPGAPIAGALRSWGRTQSDPQGTWAKRRVNAGIRQYAANLVKTRYADFKPMLATKDLLNKHDLGIGRETLRLWMVPEGSK